MLTQSHSVKGLMSLEKIRIYKKKNYTN